jgi:hypothetical protein
MNWSIWILFLALGGIYGIGTVLGQVSQVEITKVDCATILRSHLIRHECLFQFTKKGSGSMNHVTVLLPAHHVPWIGHIEATDVSNSDGSEKNTIPLPVTILSPTESSYISVNGQSYASAKIDVAGILEKFKSSSGISFLLKFKWSLSGSALPYPSHVPQGTEHRYRWTTFSDMPSIYRVEQQTHRIIVDPSLIKDYTKTLGTSGKVESNQHGLIYQNTRPVLKPEDCSESIDIVYVNNFPNISIESLRRRLTLSHWHSSIQVEEFYDVSNMSPKLLKEFSRVDLGHSFYHSNSVYPLRSIHLHLPKNSYFISYRDEVGNISTSHLRSEPFSEFLEIYPRFPLFGGWNCSFEISYNVPLYDNLTKTSNSNSYQLSSRTAFLFNDAPVRKFSLEIVLPDGSKITKISPISMNSNLPKHEFIDSELHWSYLDIYGRPCIRYTQDNLIQESVQYIHVEYEYSFMTMMSKLILLIGVFALIFILMIAYQRCDFVIFAEHLPAKKHGSTPTKEKLK